MSKILDEVLIPARDGRTIRVLKNQILRVTDVEGEQVGDMVVLNLHDTRERYCAWLSQQLQGNLLQFETLYSNPPFMRPMMHIVEDKVKVHWAGASMCNRLLLEKRGAVGRYGCNETLARILYPHGVGPHEVPDVFNVFMRMNIFEDGRRENGFPGGKKGDYTDFLADIDCLVGMSACPDDLDPTNNYKCKSLLMQVIEK
jgi:uncharacterized protein